MSTDTDLTAEKMLSYAQELETILANDDDQEFQAISRIQSCAAEMKQLRIRREKEIKAAIEALQKDRCEAAKVKDEMDQIKSGKAASAEKVQELKEECEQLEQNLRENEQVSHQNKLIEQAKLESNLYSSVTKIRWQFDSNEDEIKGFVLNTSGVKPFCLNRKENSQFFITNYLWDLMEPDWDDK